MTPGLVSMESTDSQLSGFIFLEYIYVGLLILFGTIFQSFSRFVMIDLLETIILKVSVTINHLKIIDLRQLNLEKKRKLKKSF